MLSQAISSTSWYTKVVRTFLHGCLGACVYVVYLVLLRSACAQLMLVDNLICRAPSPSASAVFGTDFGVLLQQLISRDVPDWMKQSQATQVRLCCGTLLCEELTLQVLSSISGNDIGLC